MGITHTCHTYARKYARVEYCYTFSNKETNKTPDTFTDLHDSQPAPSSNRSPHPVTESKIKKSTPGNSKYYYKKHDMQDMMKLD